MPSIVAHALAEMEDLELATRSSGSTVHDVPPIAEPLKVQDGWVEMTDFSGQDAPRTL